MSEDAETVNVSKAALERLKASVAAIPTIAQSVHAVVDGLVQRLRDIINSGAEDITPDIEALADQLDASKTDLAAAVAAGTPDQPPTPPDAA